MRNEICLTGEREGLVIRDCLAKLTRFCQHDAFPCYDIVGYKHVLDPDRLQSELLTATNSAMRARSSTKAWEPFLNKPLSVLADVPTDVDLVEASDAAYASAREKLRGCYLVLTNAKWITDMAASKMLYLKRPRLVAISDSYVREALAVGQPDSKLYPWRAPYHAARGLMVADAVRAVGRANLGALADLQQAMSPVLDDLGKTHGVRAWVSKARLVDILIWGEMAIDRDKRDKGWGDVVEKQGWSSVVRDIRARTAK